MVRVQIGKLKELCAPWGITPRRLDKLVEAGAIRPAEGGHGKGSLRLWDERSLCDVFFAHSLRVLGVRQSQFVKVVEGLRPLYQLFLRKKPERVVVRFAPRADSPAVGMPPQLVFDTRPLFTWLGVLSSAGRSAMHVQRGRPAENWRASFREAITQAGEELGKRGATNQRIDAAVEHVRRDRQRRAREEIVTVRPP